MQGTWGTPIQRKNSLALHLGRPDSVHEHTGAAPGAPGDPPTGWVPRSCPDTRRVDLGSCFPTPGAKTKTRRGWGTPILWKNSQALHLGHLPEMHFTQPA